MILQSLVHLYDEMGKKGEIAEEGWSLAKVTHRAEIDREGHLLRLIPIFQTVQKGKKTAEVPRDILVPAQVKRSSGVKANFLCDGPAYFFGIDEGKPERAIDCFEAARKLHHAVLDGCDSDTARALLAFFDGWSTEAAMTHPVIAANLEELRSSRNLIFLVDEKDPLKDDKIRDAWGRYQEVPAEEETDTGICLVTGKEHQKIARLHPAIKGVMGAQSSGATLVAFNGDSFCSYGHDGEQGANAPISERAAFAYASALNALLRDRDHAKVFGDTTVVYWTERAEKQVQDVFAALISGDRGTVDDAALNSIVESMKNGIPADLNGVRIDPDEPFYILGLAPNAARLAVRFFLKNTFGKTVECIAAHQERMRLSGPSWEKGMTPLWRTLKATVNPHAKDSASSPLLAGSLLRAVFTDSLYPEAMFQNIMLRIFSDQDSDSGEKGRKVEKVSYTKAAFIKAYLLKNKKQRWEDEIFMAVNENCREISYVLGRLFSVLENIQMQANPNINTTIKERYFNSACATPASVFPTLLKLANAHMDKLKDNTPASIFFKKKIGSLMEKITMPDEGTPLPNRLSLEEQGAFVLGYYQETQARYAGKKEEN